MEIFEFNDFFVGLKNDLKLLEIFLCSLIWNDDFINQSRPANNVIKLQFQDFFFLRIFFRLHYKNFPFIFRIIRKMENCFFSIFHFLSFQFSGKRKTLDSIKRKGFQYWGEFVKEEKL